MDHPVAAYRRFAFETLVPLCRDRFTDKAHGGFFEQLNPDTHLPIPVGSKRLMVQCRQLYVLAHAAILGDASGQDSALRGYEFVKRTYRDPSNGGWYFRATEGGEATDKSKDLYAHAFVLFALAYLHRAFAVPDAIPLAAATYDELTVHMAAPGGGFWDKADEAWAPDTSIRRQNPHMHLLEGLLALHEATGETRWLAEADRLVRLFLDHFHDSATATLGEHFAVDWRPHPEHGHIVEAGHHFEWVWLLDRYRAAGGTAPVAEAADRLFHMADRHGTDPEHGGIHDQIDRAGAPLLTTRRIWPVTEAIKAHTARIEAGQSVPEGQPGRLIAHLFKDFLRPERHGWIETMTREGAPKQTTLPGSTPYHLFLAAAEASRVLKDGDAPHPHGR
jgi:mannose-6-phosphate isomerase